MSDRFHDLRVAEVRRETADCVSIVLDVPADLTEAFAFKQGQYLTFDQEIQGESVRRSYSICAGVGEELRVAVKRVPEGRFSTWANTELKAGDTLRTMLPNGRFFTELDAGQSKHYVAFAAGSGITPILSHIKTVLATEPQSRFTLPYTNKDQASVIFKSELDDLKDRFLDRLRLFHFFTREPVDTPLYAGRMDADKVDAVAEFAPRRSGHRRGVCLWSGADDPRRSRADGGSGRPEANIHFELFTSPTAKAAADAGADAAPVDVDAGQEVFVIIDGSTHKLDYDGSKSILDTGLDAGLDLPYSCCGGVCCTCRALSPKGPGDGGQLRPRARGSGTGLCAHVPDQAQAGVGEVRGRLRPTVSPGRSGQAARRARSSARSWLRCRR